MERKAFPNGQLYAMRNSLEELLGLDVAARVGIRLARLVKRLGEEVNAIEQARLALVNKYGESGEAGVVTVQPTSAKWGEFAKEFGELMADTHEVEYEPVILPPDVKASPKLFAIFEDFLGVEEESKSG